MAILNDHQNQHPHHQLHPATTSLSSSSSSLSPSPDNIIPAHGGSDGQFLLHQVRRVRVARSSRSRWWTCLPCRMVTIDCLARPARQPIATDRPRWSDTSVDAVVATAGSEDEVPAAARLAQATRPIGTSSGACIALPMLARVRCSGEYRQRDASSRCGVVVGRPFEGRGRGVLRQPAAARTVGSRPAADASRAAASLLRSPLFLSLLFCSPLTPDASSRPPTGGLHLLVLRHHCPRLRLRPRQMSTRIQQ